MIFVAFSLSVSLVQSIYTFFFVQAFTKIGSGPKQNIQIRNSVFAYSTKDFNSSFETYPQKYRINIQCTKKKLSGEKIPVFLELRVVYWNSIDRIRIPLLRKYGYGSDLKIVFIQLFDPIIQ